MKELMKGLLIIIAVAALVGILHLPGKYYPFLRVAVTAGAVLAIGVEYYHTRRLSGWMVMMGAAAIVFNPIFPLYLHSKSMWQMIDLLTGVLFGMRAATWNEQLKQSNH